MFVIFGLVMFLVQLIVILTKLWTEGFLPNILMVARAHSISPLTLIQRVLGRRYV